MIAAACVALFLMLTGGAHGPLGELMPRYAKGQIERVVADEHRRDRALEDLSKLNHEIQRLNEEVSKDGDDFLGLVKDYGSTSEDFDRRFAAAEERHARTYDQLWDTRAALLKDVTPEEWKAIVAGAREEAAKKK